MIEPEDPRGNDPRHCEEDERLAGLRRFDFVDPEPGDILHRFARLAAQVFGTAFAAICFVEADRVRFIAPHGFKRAECPRAGSFFARTISQNDVVWIADAGEIEPGRNSPMVNGLPSVRFYAGVPLMTADGLAIGALCVMDPEPRPLADLATRGALMDLATCAMSEMECWRLNRQIKSLTTEHSHSLHELDLIYNNAPVGLTLIDRDLRFRRVNERLAVINGESADEHIGRTIHEVVPDLAEVMELMIRRVLTTGEPIWDYEVTGETPKAPGVERIWVQSYYPIPKADGGTDTVAVVVQEITEQRRLEVLDRAHVKRLRRILDGIGALAGLLDCDGTLVEINRLALDLVGLEPEDVLGQPFEQTPWWTHSPDVQAQLTDAMARARQGETVRHDVPIRTKDGSHLTMDFQLAPLRDDQGEVINLVPSGVDITDRRAAEAALAENEALFRETFEQTAVGMAHVGLDGQWLRVNDKLCDITGFSREALLNTTFQEITHPEDVVSNMENAQRLRDGEIDSYATEKRYVRADGSTTWVNLTVSPRRTACGTPQNFISIVEDINPRKKAEERVGLVVSELNHRIKNTLAMIQSVVAHGANEPTPKHEFVRSVVRRIQAMATAHDLLVRSQWRGAALAELITDVLRPHESDRIRIAGPALWLTPSAALGFCLVIHELATNAAKYGALSRDGGEVAIEWEMMEKGGKRSLFLSWVERGGPSVSPPTHRGFGSKIIEQYAATEMGGTASIGFDPEGVRVSLWAPQKNVVAEAPPDIVLPSAPEMTASAPAERPVAPSDTSPLRVLVVEDSALISMDLASILELAGHTVIGPASTVSEALALAENDGLDAAFLDVDLQGELVTPVAEKLRERGIPFAFSTGFEEGNTPLPVFAIAPVLRKPFNDQAVLSVLAALQAKASR